MPDLRYKCAANSDCARTSTHIRNFIFSRTQVKKLTGVDDNDVLPIHFLTEAHDGH